MGHGRQKGMSLDIEKLRKERETIDARCLGKGFSEDMAEFVNPKAPVCSRIEPLEIQQDDGSVIVTSTDEACRCNAYAFPTKMWDHKKYCPLSTNFVYVDTATAAANKARAGQQKGKRGKKAR